MTPRAVRASCCGDRNNFIVFFLGFFMLLLLQKTNACGKFDYMGKCEKVFLVSDVFDVSAFVRFPTTDFFHWRRGIGDFLYATHIENTLLTSTY